MRSFSALLDRLSFEHGKNSKLRLLREYFAATPDPERGFGLAALTEALSFKHAKPSTVRALAHAKIDPWLFDLSVDYVGDLAETVALTWPVQNDDSPVPKISEVVEALSSADAGAILGRISSWLDVLDKNGRWALIKLISGAMRVGVSRRLAATALSELGNIPVADIEETWHHLEPPYTELFAWVEGRAPRPEHRAGATYRPVMLAHALEAEELDSLPPEEFRAEWKWDGVRVQVVGDHGRVAVYARSGDEVGNSFPDIAEAVSFDGTLDGELLIIRDGKVAPFADLQKRLNRKKVSAAMLSEFPAAVRLYDLLFDEGTDLRALPFDERRARLEEWYRRAPRPRFDLSTQIPFSTWEELDQKRCANTEVGVEGVMLKKRDSAYVAGRPKGLWYKWKRAPYTIDAVLMYAQRGSGKRSSYYSDYTFGVWRGEELVTIGKAYFGFTDEELAELDKWIRNHTTHRFGPVREVEKLLVLEVAFEGLARSTRHKSGLAMRFPRISRIRWDKPVAEADRLETLEAQVEKLERAGSNQGDGEDDVAL